MKKENLFLAEKNLLPDFTKGAIYGEIVKSSNNERVENIKGVAREYLKKYKINIPMDAETVVTHNAVKMLITELKNEDKE